MRLTGNSYEQDQRTAAQLWRVLHLTVNYCILHQWTQKLQGVQSMDNRDVQVSLAGYTEYVA